MSTMKRVAALAATSALALAFAASALAAYTPKLVIIQAADKTTIHISIAKGNDATAKLSIYAPASTPATLGQAPGTQIGTVTASVNAKAISPDAILPLTGVVQVADPASPTIMAAATACTQTTTHAAIWLLVLTAAGQTLNVPAFVDPTTGPEAGFGAAKIVVCLPSPDIPVAAGGAQFGAQLLDVNFTTAGIFAASTAPIAAWPTVFTPYVTLGATPNPAGTVTAIGIAAVPSFTFAAKAAKRGKAKTAKVTASGKVTAGGVPAAGQSIAIFSGSRRLVSTRTSAAGSFAAALRLKKGSYSLRAKLTAADTDVTSQGCALVPAGAPACVSATAAGGVVFSKTVKVKIK